MQVRNETKVIGLIEENAYRARQQQRPDGSLPAGHNGPYHDLETPVRNTSHWLVTFAFLTRRSGEQTWLEGARSALEFLKSDVARPQGCSFHHRNKPGKDRCNGLIGAAWVFEALAAASEALNCECASRLGEDMFFQHPFDANRGLWRVQEIDGTILRFDGTFNHQLWFAAGASLLHGSRRSVVLERVGRFLDCCDRNLVLLDGGLICHSIPRVRLTTGARERIVTVVKEGVRNLPWADLSRRVRLGLEELQRKSVGYHAFNLYAFALLKQQLPLHPIWASGQLHRMLDHASSSGYRDALEENPYGYPYNPPGFELPFALSVLDRPLLALREEAEPWMQRQLERTFDPATRTLGRGTPDSVTLTARLYEATRLPDSLLGLAVVEGAHATNPSTWPAVRPIADGR